MPKQVFKPGEKVLICRDLSDLSTIQEYTVDSANTDIVNTVESGPFYTCGCWPVAYRSELEEIVRKRQQLQKELDDSMGLVYRLRNKIHSQAK